MLKALFQKKTAPLPEDADALVDLSGRVQDPRERRRCLEKAQALAPESLRVQRALLMLGDLGREKRTGDFSAIKSYLLMAFENPEAFDEPKRRAMIRDIFDHPQLRLCLSLAEDRAAFMDAYIRDLVREYGRLFISGASSHSGAVFGFSTPKSRNRALSIPLGDMLARISACPYLSAEERGLLLRALYAQAAELLQGDMELVHEAIGKDLMRELRS